MVHNSLTVRRFIVTSTLCSLGACHQTGRANCATPPTPLTGNRCPNDIRPVADPPPPPLSEGWRVHPHECFRSEVPGPWSRCLRCVSGLFMLTCLLGILWMWSAPGSPIRPYQPPTLPASSSLTHPLTTTTFCVNYEITQRANETRWGKLNQLALPTQHISQSIAGLLRDQRFFSTTILCTIKNMYM